MERGCLGAVGIGIALFSVFFVVSAAVELAGGKSNTEPGVLAGLLVFFLGTTVVGAILAWKMFRRHSPATVRPASQPLGEEERERRVLQFAEKEHGRVTVPEVAAHCNMSVAEAKAALDRLVTLQVADLRVTNSGVLVYVFPGFLSDDDKARAQDF
jgi:hypothetical protein